MRINDPTLIGLLADALAGEDPVAGPLTDALKEAGQDDAAHNLEDLLTVRKVLVNGGRLTVDLTLRADSAHEPALVLVSQYSVSCPLVLQRAPSQTRNLMEIQDSAGTIHGGIDSEGRPFGCFRTVRVLRAGEQ